MSPVRSGRGLGQGGGGWDLQLSRPQVILTDPMPPKPELNRSKVIVRSPEKLTHVPQGFTMLKSLLVSYFKIIAVFSSHTGVKKEIYY